MSDFPSRLARPAAALWAAGLFSLSGLAAAASEVVISQLYGGNGNTYNADYVELFNRSSGAVDVTGWSVQYASATGTGHFSANGVTTLAGSMQPGQYLLVRLATAATGAALPMPDASGGSNLSATGGKLALVSSASGLACNGGSAPCSAEQLAQIADLVGYGSAYFKEGAATAPAGSGTTALFRAGGGCVDTDQNGADFSAGAPAPRNSAVPLNPCAAAPVNAPIVTQCSALSVQQGMAASVVLTAADEDSQVNGAVLTSTPVSGISLGPVSPAAGEGGSATVSLQVSDAVAAGSYPVVVQFNNDEAQSASCTVNVTVPAAPTLTPIPAIQGTGETSPLLGQTLTTSGVVTAVFPGLRGFYLQDPLGDGDSASADGIFVYVNSATMPAGIAVGNQVRLTGKVAEFSGQTELTNPASMVVLASGLSVAPTEVVLPEAFNGELERYEGMLVQLATPMTVAQNYFLGRYGQLTLAADGPLEKATDRHPARSPEAIALAEENQRRLLVLDDGTTQQNPSPTPYLGADNTLRAGDRVAEALLGVLDQGPIDAGSPATLDYRLHPIQTPSFLRDNPRMAAPGPVGGNVKVASFNVLNYFNGDGAGGGFPTSRGASNPAEFERQRAKIIGALAVINADVVGLMEIENDGDGALSAIQNLVNGLNAVLGAGTYAVVADPATGTGSDAIKVALIYKPGRLALAGSALSDPHPIHNRPPLAQTFAAPNGERFSVVVNHFKSKSCADALGEDLDQGDGQGCYNARRLAQATALLAFLEQLKAAAGDQDLLVIGDLNAYGKEDPVLALAAGGLANQLAERGTLPYSYVFDGERGTLDHALASPSLAGQVAGAGHWHINADEPSFLDYNLEFKQPACLACEPDLYRPTAYRSSDHDPVIVGLQLLHGVAGTPGRDLLSGTPGDDVLEGGAGPDVLTGGGGADLFVYRDLAEALDTITDFTPGLDRLDLRGLFASLGLAAGDPVAGGYLRIQPLGLGCSVMIDPDGTVGPQKFRPLVKLQGVPADHLVVARDILR